MTTVVRKKRRPKPVPLEDAFEGDLATLVGHEDELSDDEDLCERVFSSKQEAFNAGRYLSYPEPVEPPDGGRTWTPVDLYDRPLGNRRIMFLELNAWAIEQIEAPRTREEFGAFEEQLKRARVQNGWGSIPWPRATDPERFLTHIKRLAEGFTIGNGEYVARSTD